MRDLSRRVVEDVGPFSSDAVTMSHLFLLHCHLVLPIFSPRDDPVEDISAGLLNWKEAALIGCGGGGGASGCWLIYSVPDSKAALEGLGWS